MSYEVVVVGGGIGGLTVAALLAARGIDVCLLERSSELGGCATNIEKFGYTFEPGAGLYAGWTRKEIHHRIFDELPIAPPEVQPLDPSYAVRLPDRTEILVSSESKEFEGNLRRAFPECSEEAVNFYRQLEPLAKTVRRALLKVPDLRTAGAMRSLSGFVPNLGAASQVASLSSHTAAQHLGDTSERFRSFIDLQLQMFTQTATDSCSYLSAAVVLDSARSSLFSMKGGPGSLANSLAESIRKSGGKIRLDTPVLRLAFDSNDEEARPIGVDLLSGETVTASKAIISDLTVWDTYGKLFGMSRTPTETRKQLNALTSSGAYLIFAALDESRARQLPAEHVLLPPKSEEQSLLMFSVSPSWDTRAPEGKRAVTIQAFTDVTDWFAFHEDESEHETNDQEMLEKIWQQLHEAMPELGSAIEVIDTATPRGYYDQTRRKLGMTGGLPDISFPGSSKVLSHRTHLRNVYRVGDTVYPGVGISGVAHSALAVVGDILR